MEEVESEEILPESIGYDDTLIYPITEEEFESSRDPDKGIFFLFTDGEAFDLESESLATDIEGTVGYLPEGETVFVRNESIGMVFKIIRSEQDSSAFLLERLMNKHKSSR